MRRQHRVVPSGDQTPPSSRRMRTSHKREVMSEESDSESPDWHSSSISLNASKSSVTSTEKSISDLSYSSPLNSTSPGSHTSSPRNVRSKDRKFTTDSCDEDDYSCDNIPSEKDISFRSPMPRESLYPDLEQFKTPMSKSPVKAPSRPGKKKGVNYSHTPSPSTTSRQEKKGKNSDKIPQSNILLPSCSFIILLLVIYYFFFMPSSLSEVPARNEVSEFDSFIKEVEGLQEYFPNQQRRLWRLVIASSRHILKEPNSTFPSVIILASKLNVPHLSNCIAEKIASSFLKSRGLKANHIPYTDVESLKNLDVHEQKLRLDKNIQTALQSSYKKTYIIRNLQSLSPQAALLLHGLCDGDNAPYKDVMIIMTLEVKGHTPALTANIAEDYLTNLWTSPQVEYDKVAALMSRISNNIEVLQSEDSHAIHQMCH